MNCILFFARSFVRPAGASSLELLAAQCILALNNNDALDEIDCETLGQWQSVTLERVLAFVCLVLGIQLFQQT